MNNAARRKEPMSNLIRAHSEVVRRMELGAAGAVFVEVDDEPLPSRKPKRFTYEIAWDDSPIWDGWNVRCVETGQWMRSEGYSAERKARELLERLEEGGE